MNDLRVFIEQLHIANPGEKEEQLLKYMEGVLGWNDKVNVNAIRDRCACRRQQSTADIL